MKEKFEDRKITGSLRIKLDRDDHDCGKYWEEDKSVIINAILSTVRRYENMGYTLTLRQLYYQLVATNAMPNDQACYSKLSTLLDDCRYSGIVDWDSIEDRGRVPHTPYYEDSVADSLRRTLLSYKLDRRIGQKNYVELWTEKDAISNIMKDSVRDYTITVGINKGFASSTAIYNAYRRFVDEILEGRKVTVLYFGDHDPSGLSMITDIRYRLELMMSKGDYTDKLFRLVEAEELVRLAEKYDLFDLAYEANESGDKETFAQYMALGLIKDRFEIRHIGLTKEQITKFNLPSNPAKLSDPRAKAYVAEHGDVSWEVDALNPKDIVSIVKDALTDLLDSEAYNKILPKEDSDRELLSKFIEDSNN